MSILCDLTRFVDPRQGVDNNGNTVIGLTRPNASVNPSPDTVHGGDSGYFSGQDIRGFSRFMPAAPATASMVGS